MADFLTGGLHGHELRHRDRAFLLRHRSGTWARGGLWKMGRGCASAGAAAAAKLKALLPWRSGLTTAADRGGCERCAFRGSRVPEDLDSHPKYRHPKYRSWHKRGDLPVSEQTVGY